MSKSLNLKGVQKGTGVNDTFSLLSSKLTLNSRESRALAPGPLTEAKNMVDYTAILIKLSQLPRLTNMVLLPTLFPAWIARKLADSGTLHYRVKVEKD